MKRGIWLMAIGLFALAIGLTACSSDSANDVVSPDQQVEFVVTRIEIGSAKKSDYLAVLQKELDYLRSLANAPKATLDDAWIDSSNISYLIGKGKDVDGQCASIAVQLPDGFEIGDVVFLGKRKPPTHTCTGAPCEQCEFKRDEETNEIIGCKCEYCIGCDPINGHCNHTISEG